MSGNRFKRSDVLAKQLADDLAERMAEAIEVINPQRLSPAIKRVLLVDWRQPVHLVIEFQRDADVVRGQQRFALKRALNPGCRTAFGLEIGLCLVQIVFVKSLETHHFDSAGPI